MSRLDSRVRGWRVSRTAAGPITRMLVPRPIQQRGQSVSTYGEWLSMELEARGMSQRVLAHRSGVDHSTISRIIRGGRDPMLGTARAIAAVLRTCPVCDSGQIAPVLPTTPRVTRVGISTAPIPIGAAPSLHGPLEDAEEAAS